jgi:glycosyltransferase involved in cell wall biosynthesis
LSEVAPSDRPWRGFSILVISPTPTHPQDYGNRKRVFAVCSELRRQGAQIHFLHYPAEHHWRRRKPLRAEREMMAAWDSYQIVAPSRPLHTASTGEDHTIDEWADPDLARHIAWLCRVQMFDAIIVNYTWMSFCLDHVPADLFKICDTHDAVGGRRELLALGGIRPEYFHTTTEEEAKGLRRADLVWAIKDSEREYFTQELGLPNCLTMLHADPEQNCWTAPPSTDGWLRAGVIGARNNLNIRNLEEFLQDALPIFESYAAPIKIVIAGTCSDHFVGRDHPNLQVLGPVADVREFYARSDVVIAPLRFSTGLKVKVAEALALGVPLVAHAHAMDGYPTDEPLHLLPSFKAMAAELVKLAFDPTPLAGLAACSHFVHAATRQSVLAAIEATRRQLVTHIGRGLCIVAPMSAFDKSNILYDHLYTVLNYLSYAGPVTLHMVGPRAAEADAEYLQDLRLSVFAEPALIAALGAEAPPDWQPLALSDLLTLRGFKQAYFLCDASPLLAAGAGNLSRVFVRWDAIELSGGDPRSLIGTVAPAQAVVIAADIRPLGWLEMPSAVVETVQMGFSRDRPFQSHALVGGAEQNPPAIVILGRAADPLGQAVADLAKRLGFRPVLLDPDDPRTAAALRGDAAANGVANAPIELRRAALIVRLAEFGDVAAILDEMAERAGISVVRVARGRAAAALHGRAPPILATSVAGLLQTVARALTDPVFRETLRSASAENIRLRFDRDAGWTRLWHTVSVAMRPSATTALFGE